MNIIKNIIIFHFFFLIYLKFLFEIFFLNIIPMHDTLWSYINFQYVFNYFDYYNLFPSWIDTNTGGYPMYGILNFSSSAITFPVIFASKLLGIGSFFAYLIIMSIFNLIFFIGLFLFIKIIKKYLIIFTIILFHIFWYRLFLYLNTGGIHLFR